MIGLLVSYTACALAVSIGILYPYVALLVYVAFAIVKPAEMWFWTLSGSHLSAVAFCGLLMGWLLRGLGNWRLGYAWMPTLSLLFFWLWSWVSWCNSTDSLSLPMISDGYSLSISGDADPGLQNLLQLAKIIIPCFIGITLIDSEGKALGLLITLVLAEGYVAWEMNVAYLEYGYNRIRVEGFAGLDNNSVAVSLVSCCIPALILAYYTRRLWLRLVFAACGMLIGHAILLSFSRGGMIALLISVMMAVIVMRESYGKYLLILVVVTAGLALCGPEVRERFLSMFVPSEELDPAARSRLELWEDCIDVIRKFPLCGVGPENWPRIAASYGWPEGKEAHSLWLQTGAEVGIPGLLSILMFYLVTGLRLYRCRFSSQALTSVRDSVLVGLSGFVVAAQFVSLELLETPYYLALCGMAALRLTARCNSAGGERRCNRYGWASSA